MFAHPQTGEVLYPTGLTRRLGKALKAAKLPRTASVTCATRSGHRAPPPGVPMRTLQEWIGHEHLSTTERYAAYAPSTREANMIAAAFAPPAPAADGALTVQSRVRLDHLASPQTPEIQGIEALISHRVRFKSGRPDCAKPLPRRGFSRFPSWI